MRRVERLAAAFEARGVAEGSTVTIGLPNSAGFAESMFAAWSSGTVPQPVAQVQLGRRDARLPIDVTAVAHEHTRPSLPGELSRQIGQVLGQQWCMMHGVGRDPCSQPGDLFFIRSCP